LHYVVTSLGCISNIEAITCSSFASAACTLRTSLSSITRGLVKSSVVALDPIDLSLNKLNIVPLEFTNVIVIVLPDPASSDTSNDLITEVLAEGTVYRVV